MKKSSRNIILVALEGDETITTDEHRRLRSPTMDRVQKEEQLR